jgi:broad specificity phosphatase PhoE
MPSIYLLRHCEYDNPRNILPGRLPLGLSRIGIEHAKNLQRYFSDKNIKKIHASAVERTKQTATIIANDTIPIQFDQRILETFSAYQGYWDDNWHGTGFHFFTHRDELGGENMEDIQKRMADFWGEITEQIEENIIICSHGDPLLALYSYIHDIPLVSEDVQDEHIPGWLQKGEFIEVVWEQDKIVQTLSPRSA